MTGDADSARGVLAPLRKVYGFGRIQTKETAMCPWDNISKRSSLLTVWESRKKKGENSWQEQIREEKVPSASLEHSELGWFTPEEMSALDFCPADAELLPVLFQ